MKLPRGYWRPVVALTALAAVLAFLAGLRAVPPTETEIIEAAADAYVAETGGVRTDCFARPSVIEGVRMVVICTGEGTRTAWVQAYDTLGRPVEMDADLGSEPVT